MGTKSSVFIRQFVIGLGFLSGAFTAIGIDPQDEVIRFIGGAVGTVYPDPQVSYVFFILPVVLLVISVVAAYMKGKVMGLISVLVAYFSGVLILVSSVLAIILLLIAVVLGYLATNRRLFWAVRSS
jgi:ABC-type multidrug transport system permease subunit